VRNGREFWWVMAAGVAALVLPQTLAAQAGASGTQSGNPNIVYILADDLGYGDVSCFYPAGKISTPNIDRLATQGMRFTDAHSGSAVCSPTRYGILTGRYAWRTRLQSSTIRAYEPPLIAPGRLTVSELLRQNGYTTACFGKWHLGWDWPKRDGEVVMDEPVGGGPVDHGFDYFFGKDVPSFPPFCFIENNRTVGDLLPTTQSTLDWSGSPSFIAPDWSDENILPETTRRTVQWIRGHSAQARAGKPFFLYVPLTSPHLPWVPTPEWQGRSGLGPYADFVMQTDAVVGQILQALEEQGLAENTLVIFTSDNGCTGRVRRFHDEKGHRSNGDWRGWKTNIWEGGHRIPFIARWPGRISPGSTSAQLIGLGDLMATCAQILGKSLPANAGEDSVSILPALLGEDRAPLRDAVVNHSGDGKFAIRQGNWKLELCSGSGGSVQPDRRGLPNVQLYDLAEDPGEQTNLQAEFPEVVKRLTALLEKYVADGRSTPGPAQKNDAEIDLWKLATTIQTGPGGE